MAKYDELRDACTCGDVLTVSKILSSIPGSITRAEIINTLDSVNRYSLLHWAASKGQLEVVQLLIKLIPNVDAPTDRDGGTALYCAARNGQLKVVELLINSNANVNAKNKDGYSPLYWAAFSGYSEVCRLLINSGANVNIQTNKGATPLHVAVLFERVSVVELLLSRGADIQIKNSHGKTAIGSSSEGRKSKYHQIAPVSPICNTRVHLIAKLFAQGT
jgi:ankyrin repeat protein